MTIKIFIDQGHNPQKVNAGAEAFGLREQDITYNVGIYLANILNQDPHFEARTSRNSPDEILGTTNTTSLETRVELANNWPANYFLSIHTNANTNPNINGTEIYVYQEYSQSYYLSEYILDSIVNNLKTQNKGVRTRPSLYVLRKTKMPSLLIELAYLTNESDAFKLQNNQYQFSQAIYEGLITYFGF